MSATLKSTGAGSLCAKILGCSLLSKEWCWGLQRANIPDYLTVKLFSKISNLYDHDTSTLWTDRRTS